MPRGFYRDIVRLLGAHGFSKVSGGKGSHEKWKNGEGLTLTVPRNLYSRHTANAILKSAGSDDRL